MQIKLEKIGKIENDENKKEEARQEIRKVGKVIYKNHIKT